ncbi:hypothetical protein A3A93_04480 [Candidatus Roizmanbacteria bacterium RIFCSPLOWO2_01_FULL_38_12]|uniref:Uncharacterized protein n=1 Tax=Candidatus Roizmanbacteria bacterium RIFCSPLOWO2_01_FULL_38_12 TaxID=1802061 RepID=A0A1F7IXG4_9BACT|nr:MAG: hypothetical protein A2861_01950 [Candidatus Roizmanbacteria bacterium RIFCSPHIGHO2_01_FULL_38_15]OGK35496.1 MAG: hypothetical protein A3F59_00980 [Candidatus Roizmanbacteria bacterium RIFCSPHIGHO2_12_FULL_38_13]OGK48025.1 MAG: hypothetical protein A3A93_04480 [Candidatus Roizmanbacteria bacterium RIFCSPLOWO2_01_FULL_38_12]
MAEILSPEPKPLPQLPDAYASPDELVLTPEEQTRRFFEEQDVFQLTAALIGRPLAIPNTDICVVIDQAQAFPEVGPNYQRGKDGVNIHMPRAKLWAFHIARANMNQALVTTFYEDKSGACVRLLRGSRRYPETNELVPMAREGDIAKTLGLLDNEVATLQFGEDPKDPTLYVIRAANTTEQANQYIQGITT